MVRGFLRGAGSVQGSWLVSGVVTCRSWPRSTSPSARMAARSNALASSRTLPGQAAWRMRSRAPSSSRSGGRPSWALMRASSPQSP